MSYYTFNSNKNWEINAGKITGIDPSNNTNTNILIDSSLIDLSGVVKLL